jgi:hypothetical protein
MTSAVPSWTCPQCRRRVPGREPLCHCGFSRGDATAVARSVLPVPPWAVPARGLAMAAALLAMGVVAAVVYSMRPREPGVAAGTSTSGPHPQARLGYPALPSLPTVTARRGRGAGPVSRSAGPRVAQPVTPLELLEPPLRSIAADTSVLEMSYRSFAGACVASSVDGRDHGSSDDWLATLKTAALRPGVTLRQGGLTVGCEAARQSLVARAGALKSLLDAAASTARASGLPEAEWRRLVAVHELGVWDRY